MPDFNILSTPNFASAALGGYQAGQALGRQKRLDAALGAVDLSRPETIMPVLQADPQTGAQLMTAAAGVRKTADQTRAREIIPQAVGGDKAAISELWGLDHEIASKLTDDHIKLVDQGVKAAGNAALGLLQLPEGQRSAAWDAAIDSLDERFPGLAQYKGQYSATNLQSVLAQAGMTKDYYDVTQPKYQPLVPGGTLGQTNSLAGPVYGGGAQPEGGDPVSAGGTFSRMLSAESSGRQFAENGQPLTSPKGAVGIAQVMPDTAPEAARLAGLPWDEQRYRTDPEYNASLGRAYFEEQKQVFGGDERKAVAAYNAGPARVRAAVERGGENWQSQLPSETQQYLGKVFGSARAGLNPPRAGAERVGAGGVKYRFKGGDPASREAWERMG